MIPTYGMTLLICRLVSLMYWYRHARSVHFSTRNIFQYSQWALIQLNITTRVICILIHLSNADVHMAKPAPATAADILYPQANPTLVQKKLRARKAPRYTFLKVGMFFRHNIFHNLSKALNQPKPTIKFMVIFVRCLHPVTQEIVPAPWRFLMPP